MPTVCLRLHSFRRLLIHRKPLVQNSLRALRGSARTAGHQLHTHTHVPGGGCGCRWGYLTALLGQARKVICPLYLSFPGGNLADLFPSSQNCVRMHTIPSSAFILGHVPRLSAEWGKRKPLQFCSHTSRDCDHRCSGGQLPLLAQK